jgi:predicted helicase
MISPDTPTPNYFILLNDQGYYEEVEKKEASLNPYGAATAFFIPLYSVEDEQVQILNMEVVNYLSEKLKLFHSPFKEIGGEVCFLNSEEVRAEFKVSFSSTDIFNYIAGYLGSDEYENKYKKLLHKSCPFVPFPKDEFEFWRFVQIGKKKK